MGIPRNPLIGLTPDDTLSQCRSVLALLRGLDSDLLTVRDADLGLCMLINLLDDAIGYEMDARRPWAPSEASNDGNA